MMLFRLGRRTGRVFAVRGGFFTPMAVHNLMVVMPVHTVPTTQEG